MANASTNKRPNAIERFEARATCAKGALRAPPRGSLVALTWRKSFMLTCDISHPLDSSLAKEPRGPNEQEPDRESVGEPILDTAPDDRADVHFSELFGSSYHEPTDDS